MRLLQGILVLLVVSAITFSLLAAAGGDALSEFVSNPLMSERAISELRHVYGLDQPLPVRYLRWAEGAVSGDLGRSFHFQVPVWSVLGPHLLNTLELSIAALTFALALSLGLGFPAARWPGGLVDKAASFVVLLGASTPRIVLALLALVIIARTTLVSVGSSTSIGKLLIAAFVLSVPVISLLTAQIQDGLKAAMREDFITVARARGLGEWRILFKHAFRAALNPVITTAGYSLGSLIGGSVIVETVLGWPGMGQLTVVAVRSRDVPLLMAVVLFASGAVVLGNLISDILLVINDPRLREEKAVIKEAAS